MNDNAFYRDNDSLWNQSVSMNCKAVECLDNYYMNKNREELNKSINWLKNYPPLKGNIKSVKTAVLWKKKDSTFEPDFCAQKLDSNPWIVQPFERYEEIKIEDLVKKHRS